MKRKSEHSNKLALYLAQGAAISHELKFVRHLNESEASEHRSFFSLIVSIRNLLESLKIVEHAIKEWDDFYESQYASPAGFSQTYANYRMATLLAMLIMLKGHVSKVLKPLLKANKIDETGLEPWFRQDSRDGVFLKLADDMRCSALHVKLPIHSYQVTRSITEPTMISLKLHSESNSDVQTQELEDFRARLGMFMNDTCRLKLTSKLKETLNAAFEFYRSLVAGESTQSLESMCILEVNPGNEGGGAEYSPSYSFLGEYLLGLELGFRSNFKAAGS